MASLRPFSDEQARALVNLRQRYEAWRDTERALRGLPYDLRRKRVGEYEYLYELRDRSGNGTSLGRWSDDAQRRFDSYRDEKHALKDRLALAREAVDEGARLARALRVPQLASAPGPILRSGGRGGAPSIAPGPWSVSLPAGAARVVRSHHSVSIHAASSTNPTTPSSVAKRTMKSWGSLISSAATGRRTER